MSIVMSWAIGLAFLIVLLISIQDVDAILDSSLDMPVAQLFWVCLQTLLQMHDNDPHPL